MEFNIKIQIYFIYNININKIDLAHLFINLPTYPSNYLLWGKVDVLSRERFAQLDCYECQRDLEERFMSTLKGRNLANV